jgi:hypothetical protein
LEKDCGHDSHQVFSAVRNAMSDQDAVSASDDSDQMHDVRALYSEVMATCLDCDAEAVDVLVALTLVLRDLALRYHGPDAARSRSVDALDHSFALEPPVWPSGALH